MAFGSGDRGAAMTACIAEALRIAAIDRATVSDALMYASDFWIDLDAAHGRVDSDARSA